MNMNVLFLFCKHVITAVLLLREGMLKSRETDEDTKQLVERAARGLVHTVQVQGTEAVMDWEVRACCIVCMCVSIFPHF